MKSRNVNTVANRFLESKTKWKRPQLNILNFGIDFLDDALGGVFPGDLVLIGAPTGMGKTQLCTDIALHNSRAGKNIIFFPLEAEVNEIERRMAYKLYASFYFDDDEKMKTEYPVSYLNWYMGRLIKAFEKYHDAVENLMANIQNVKTVYRGDEFSVKDLLNYIGEFKASKPDLLIIDHAHYFDYDSDKENTSLKEIAKACRTITQIAGIPIILVAQLRKGLRSDREICPSIDEFHGTSDLTKIATRVVTFSHGKLIGNEDLKETFIRVCKCRKGSQAAAYVAKSYYNLKQNQYEAKYKLGKLTSSGKEWEPLIKKPLWATNCLVDSISTSKPMSNLPYKD